MPKKTHADIDFRLQWKSSAAEHTDTYLIANINLESDIFPANLKEEIAKLDIGESYSQKIQAKDFLGEGYSSDKVITFESSLFDIQFKNQFSPPILYRFYPSAIAWQGLNTNEKDYSPFRLISKNSEEMIADCNHPLAKYYLTLTATKIAQYKSEDNSPRKNIGKILMARGPGMQAPFEFGDSTFFDDYPFKKSDIKNNSKSTLDSKSVEKIEKLYSELLPKHSKILDLMSDDSSYLEKDYQTGLLTGIGKREEQLSNNKRLDTYIAQDLSKDSTLPFETNSFDDAICTLSIEYLTDPLALMREVARVVNQKGKFIITFSDEFIPDETFGLWPQLHPFERIQLVLEYFRDSALFSNLNTLSQRGILRSSESTKIHKKPHSSIYAVWGTVN